MKKHRNHEMGAVMSYLRGCPYARSFAHLRLRAPSDRLRRAAARAQKREIEQACAASGGYRTMYWWRRYSVRDVAAAGGFGSMD